MLERHITNIQTNDELIHSQQGSILIMSQPDSMFSGGSQLCDQACLICGSTEGIDMGNGSFKDFCSTCMPEIPDDQISLAELEDNDCKDEGNVQGKGNKRVNDDGEAGCAKLCLICAERACLGARNHPLTHWPYHCCAECSAPTPSARPLWSWWTDKKANKSDAGTTCEPSQRDGEK